MLSTELPIVTEVSPVQPQKVSSPMLSTEFPIVTEVSPVQFRKA